MVGAAINRLVASHLLWAPAGKHACYPGGHLSGRPPSR